MSYRNITILAASENGGPGLKVAQAAIEPCPTASTGWGIMTPGEPDPINAHEMTHLRGWGNLDGPAIIHRGNRIPVSQIPDRPE